MTPCVWCGDDLTDDEIAASHAAVGYDCDQEVEGPDVRARRIARAQLICDSCNHASVRAAEGQLAEAQRTLARMLARRPVKG